MPARPLGAPFSPQASPTYSGASHSTVHRKNFFRMSRWKLLPAKPFSERGKFGGQLVAAATQAPGFVTSPQKWLDCATRDQHPGCTLAWTVPLCGPCSPLRRTQRRMGTSLTSNTLIQARGCASCRKLRRGPCVAPVLCSRYGPGSVRSAAAVHNVITGAPLGAVFRSGHSPALDGWGRRLLARRAVRLVMHTQTPLERSRS